MADLKEKTKAVEKKAREKSAGLWAEFKAFAFKGNVMDMAIGVIIGTAFGKIVTSLVGDVFMPLLSWVVGTRDYSQANIVLREEVLDEAGNVVTPGVSLMMGSFIMNVVDFFLMAVIVFLFVKLIAKLSRKKKEEPAPAAPPEPSKEEVLLTEIRDLLKEKNNQ